MTRIINSIVLAVIVAVVALSIPTSTFAAQTACKPSATVKCPAPKPVTLTAGEVALKGSQTSKPAAKAAEGNVNVQVVGAVKNGGVTVTVDIAGKNLTFCVGSAGALKGTYIQSGAADFYGVMFSQGGNNFPAIPGGC